MINRKFFFDSLRTNPFAGLDQSQVNGMTIVLDEWEENHAKQDDRWLAYMFATIFHETARTMQPIKEHGGDNYFFCMYDRKGERPAVAKALGNTEDGDGVRFPGRGFVQLTGRRNYGNMSKLLGIDLVENPDLALEPDVATKILFVGMIRGEFTGQKFADYFDAFTEDWVEARRIINRLDKAETIAGYGKTFYAAISYTTG